MWPTYADGDRVLVDEQAYAGRAPAPGDVVLARHPYRNAQLIKRVHHVTADGDLFVVGDNPDAAESTDSHAFGPFRPDQILGRVTGPWPGRN